MENKSIESNDVRNLNNPLDFSTFKLFANF